MALRFSTALLIAVILSSALLTGGAPPHVLAQPNPAPDLDPGGLLKQASSLTAAGDWAGLQSYARVAAPAAEKAGDLRSASLLYYHLSRAYYQLFDYADALSAARRSRDLAVPVSFWPAAAHASFAAAIAQVQTGSYRLAEQAGRDMLFFSSLEDSRTKTRTLEMHTLMGVILREQGLVQESRIQYQMAIAEAEQIGVVGVEADALEQVGFSFLKERAYDTAEEYLIDAFRLRRLFVPSHVGASFRSLGRLRQAQGRLRAALQLYDLAERAGAPSMMPHQIPYFRAQIYARLGERRKALDQLRQSTRFIRSLRLNLPFGDESQIAAEGRLQDVYSLLTDLSAQAALEAHSAVLIRESFVAALENRAASLRTRARAGAAWRSRLPPVYWVALDKFRRLQFRPPTPQDPNAARLLSKLQSEVAEMESRAAQANSQLQSAPNVDQIRSSLAPTELLVSFQLGEQRSWCWALSRDTLRLYRLPPKAAIAERVSAFRGALEHNRPAVREYAVSLFQLLLAPIDGLRSASLLSIIPDDTLFDLPFSALVSNSSGVPQYLIETHSIRLCPTALFSRSRSASPSGDFLGVGDPVANRADIRWQSGLSFRDRFFPPPVTLELPRLIGSAAELERCRRAWFPGNAQLLVGPAIHFETLSERLRGDSSPFVLHFATHVVQPPEQNSPVILLGLTPQGATVVLADSDIEGLRAPRFVTLSGCGSGRGPLSPGTGLLGLTRAWLMSGAQGVMATLWGVFDDSGGLLERYYLGLREQGPAADSRSAALSLQKAQRTAIRQGGPASDPYSWGAYFVIGTF